MTLTWVYEILRYYISASKHTWLTEIHSLLTSGIALLELNCFPKFRLSYPPYMGRLNALGVLSGAINFTRPPFILRQTRHTDFGVLCLWQVISSSSSCRKAFSRSLPASRSFARTVGPPLAAGHRSLLHPCRGRSDGLCDFIHTLFVLGTDDIHFLTSISSLSLILILIVMMWE